MKACMGGHCAKRAQCPNYTEGDRSDPEPAERLCWRGHDGFGPLCELVEDDGSAQVAEQRTAVAA